MATTSPDNIRTPNAGDQYALVQDLGVMADSIQSALTKRANTFQGTAAQRTAFTSTATNGMLWQDTDGIKMIWRKDGSSWAPAVWRWSGTTTQMNSFAAPDGFEWFSTTDNSEYVRLTGAWTRDWEVADPVPYTGSTLSSASKLFKHKASGMVTGWVGVTRTSWASTQIVAALPSGWRPVSIIGVSYAANGAGTPYVGFAQVNNSTGQITTHASPPASQNWAVGITLSFVAA